MEHFQIKWGQGYLFGGHNYFIERIVRRKLKKGLKTQKRQF